jgi:hypothetical protein
MLYPLSYECASRWLNFNTPHSRPQWPTPKDGVREIRNGDLQRCYKDNGDSKSTMSFGLMDLPLDVRVLQFRSQHVETIEAIFHLSHGIASAQRLCASRIASCSHLKTAAVWDELA